MSVHLGYPIVLVGPESLVAVVVGGGVVGTRKVRGLVAADARVTLVAPDATDELRALAADGRIAWEPRTYRTGDLAGALLAFAATDDRAVNHEVARDARKAGVLCNVADVPDEGAFTVPAVHRADDLLIAVGTGGASPSRASAVRDGIAAWLGGSGA